MVANVFCRYLLQYTSVAVNRAEKLSATMKGSAANLSADIHQCKRHFFQLGELPWALMNSSAFKSCSFGSTSFAGRGVQTPKMSNKP